MRLYAQVSGTLFGLIAIGQGVRALMGWPVQVADLTVPVWVSVCACVAMLALATWAFRAATRTA